MMRSWLVCCAALALVVPMAQGEEGVPTLKTLAQQQKDILTKLNQVQNDMASLKDRLDRLETAKSNSIDSIDLKTKFDDLRAEVQRLRYDLNANRSSTSDYQQMPPVEGEPLPKRSESWRLSYGMVQIKNDYPTVQSIYVNDRLYTLAPGQTQDVPVPPGRFTYQLADAEMSARISSVALGRTKRISIYIP